MSHRTALTIALLFLFLFNACNAVGHQPTVKSKTPASKPSMPKATTTESTTPKPSTSGAVCPAKKKKMSFNLIDISSIPEKEQLIKIVQASPMIQTKEIFGTGFLFSSDGWILTDMHVIGVFDTVTVTFFAMTDEDDSVIEEKVTVPGKVYAWSNDKNDDDEKNLDLALIKIDKVPDDVQPLKLGTADALKKAQPLWRFGYCDGYLWAYGFYTPSPKQNKSLLLDILMPESAGTSGGPIVAMDELVVGIMQQGRDGHSKIMVNKNGRKSVFRFPVTSFLPIDKIQSFLDTALPKPKKN